MAENAAKPEERHVAVLIVHGMLAENANFARPMIAQLRDRLDDISSRVHFGSVFWAHKLRDRQNQYLGDIGKLTSHEKLRRFVVQGLGDAAAYQKTRRSADSPYYEIQKQIDDKIKELDKEIRAQSPAICPLVVIGHSLGSHIMSSYAWDVNKLKRQRSPPAGAPADSVVTRMWQELTAPNASAFRRLETFSAFVTIGSNIPLFTFAFGAEGAFPLTMVPSSNDDDDIGFTPAFPGSAVPAEFLAEAKWVNFYSKRDILGYPLKKLNSLWANDPLIQDVCIESEAGWFKRLPLYACYLAHVGYWTNSAVINETARLIRLFAGAQPTAKNRT